jgi:hypothetical protein
MPRRNRIRVDSIEIKATQKNVIGGCGLALFMRYLKKAKIFEMINSRLPESSSNSSYDAEVYVKTLWALKMLYPDVNAPLIRIDEMRESKAIKQALMVAEIPCSESVGDWLRRIACCERVGTDAEQRAILGGYEDGLVRARDMFYEVTGEVMKRMASEIGETLDFDASCIFGDKTCDEWMYNEAKGSMSYLSFMGRICTMAELEEGNHAPADNIGRRIAACVEFAKKNGIAVRVIRSDSAGYESEVINGCERAGCKFYVRADMDRAVRAACQRIDDWAEYDVEVSKGKTSRREMGTAVHCMERTKSAFTLVVKREALREKKDNRQSALPELVETNWKYWCIATNESVKTCKEDEGLTPAEVEENFNDHCNVENRIKQIKSDAGVGRLPTSELGANRVYVYIMAMLHNLFEMFKYECLPSEYKNKRLSTIMREILLSPGKLVVQGHKMVIDLAVYFRWAVELYEGILKAIKERVRALPRATNRPTFGDVIFHRE